MPVGLDVLLSVSKEPLAVVVQDPHKWPIHFCGLWLLLCQEVRLVMCHVVHLPSEMLDLLCSCETFVKKKYFFPLF